MSGRKSARSLRSAADLIEAGLVPAEARNDIARVGARYAIALTPQVARLIETDDPADPIARQFIPDVRELDALPHESADPIGDDAHSPVPGIVHRYRNRALLKITHVCPVYCRFCFRREMVGPNQSGALTHQQLQAALAYLRARTEIGEVILTGGDPFVLSPRRLLDMTQALESIPHVEIVRWHTRVPVVDPGRITADLTAALKACTKTIKVAIHTNHARELTPDARAAVARLHQADIGLLSQSVLLRGVNDTADALEDLMRALVENAVTPYYLHHGDLAPGTSHFRTTIEDGLALMRELRRRLPADAVPRYILDIPGGHGKVDIETHVHPIGNGIYAVRDPQGRQHVYTGDACRA